MRRDFRLGATALALVCERSDGKITAGLAEHPIELDDYTVGDRFITLQLRGRTLRLLYEIVGGHIHVAYNGDTYEFIPAELEADDESVTAASFTPEVVSPMPGKVLEVMIAPGDSVDADQPLLLLEAMKMEQTVRASAPACVVAVHVEAGAMVGPGEVLVVLAQTED